MNQKTKLTMAAILSVFVLFGGSVVLATSPGNTVTLSVTTHCEVDNVVIVPDTDPSDGHVTYLYGAWALQDPQGIPISTESPQQMSTQDFTAMTTFVADMLGEYKLSASVFFVQQHYAAGSWITDNSGECSVEPNTAVSNITVPLPDVGGIVAAINSLYTLWLNNLYNGPAAP